MHWIQIDDEVSALLERHAKPFVDTENDVLRRLLLAAPEPVSTAAQVAAASRSVIAPRGTKERKDGDLQVLLKFGLVKAGDLLVHEQPRKGATHLATVLADGWIALDDDRAFSTPSGALAAQLGHQVNGWECWRHEPSGRRLAQLRDTMASRSSTSG